MEIFFGLAEAAYVNGDKKLKNAIDVSFVEGLDFVTSHNVYSWAWQMMPDVLKKPYEEFRRAR